MYMGKVSKGIATSVVLIIFICLIFTTGCSKGGITKNISNDEIYPKGNISTAKVFDKSNNEKFISLNRDDAEFIVQTLKDCKKELVTEYESGMVEMNIQFTDSTIQLLRKDDEIIYYVFHNSRINGVCYKIRSEKLSKFILKFT
jgi:hypothetical protein